MRKIYAISADDYRWLVWRCYAEYIRAWYHATPDGYEFFTEQEGYDRLHALYQTLPWETHHVTSKSENHA